MVLIMEAAITKGVTKRKDSMGFVIRYYSSNVRETRVIYTKNVEGDGEQCIYQETARTALVEIPCVCMMTEAISSVSDYHDKTTDLDFTAHSTIERDFVLEDGRWRTKVSLFIEGKDAKDLRRRRSATSRLMRIMKRSVYLKTIQRRWRFCFVENSGGRICLDGRNQTA